MDALAPQPGDIIVEGKLGLDTFASTNLDFILRSKGIQTVVLGGFRTNCCVESTMRTAYEHGFEVSPCRCSGFAQADPAFGPASPAGDRGRLKFDDPMFSKPMNAESFLKLLRVRDVGYGVPAPPRRRRRPDHVSFFVSSCLRGTPISPK